MSGILIDIILTLGILLVIILLAPIHLGFLGEYAETFNFQGRFRWAGGLLSIEVMRNKGVFHWSLGCLGLKKSIPKNRKTTPGSKTPQVLKKRTSSFGNLSAFINPQLFTAVKAVLIKLIQALHLHFNLSGTYGFDDPSLTGAAVGLMAALNTGNRDRSINLNPDFTRETADIRGSIRGWFSPLQIIVIGVVFFLKKPVRAIWWPKLKFHKKQKGAVQYA